MDWHTEKGALERYLKENPSPVKAVSEEEKTVDSQKDSKVEAEPEYKDYKKWSDIPEKERKHYGI